MLAMLIFHRSEDAKRSNLVHAHRYRETTAEVDRDEY